MNETKPAEATATENPSVFVCYAHADNKEPARWRDRVRDRLAPLERDHGVRVFADNDITTGELWDDRIKKELREADVAILLISQDFLNSNYIRSQELPELLLGALARGTKIVPVVIRPATIELTVLRYVDPVKGPQELPLADLQTFNPPNEPWSGLRENEQEVELVRLANHVAKLLAPSTVKSTDASRAAGVPIGLPLRRRRKRTAFLAAGGLGAAILLAIALFDGFKTDDRPPSAFAIWLFSEVDGRMNVDSHPVSTAEVARRRASGEFVELLRKTPGLAGDPGAYGIYRLSDEVEITATSGDPLAGGNTGVIVAPRRMIERHPDAHQAIVFLRSQIPGDWE